MHSKRGDVMVKVRQGLIGLTLILMVSGTAGCASNTNASPAGDAQRQLTATPATGTPTFRARAVPTMAPCQYPTSADILALEYDSSLVIKATVLATSPPSSTTVPGVGGASASVAVVPITHVKVLARRAGVQVTPSSVLTPWSMAPGEYLLFLTGAQANIPTHGLWGIYRISGQQVLMSCVTVDHPARPTPAAGTPPEFASLVTEIPPSLPRAGS